MKNEHPCVDVESGSYLHLHTMTVAASQFGSLGGLIGGTKPEVQPSNPKQLYGDKKLPLYLVPFSFVANVSVALFEGMRKYGLVNWRASEVEAMTYVSAQDRHVKKWVNGERCDPETKVHHLASAAACLCILIDAEVNGSLTDNRPLPCNGIDTMISELEATLDNLRNLHADKSPHHYTMKDAAQ